MSEKRCNCTAYARWMARLNGESPGECYYRNPRCPEHQGNSFPDREAQQAELRATVLDGGLPVPAWTVPFAKIPGGSAT